MTIEQIKEYYNQWNAEKKTADQIANEIFNGETGVVRRFNESVLGVDVRRDITQLSILIEELFRAIKKYLEKTQADLDGVVERVEDEFSATLDAIRHIVSRITVAGELALIDVSPLEAYNGVNAMVQDTELKPGDVVRTNGYFADMNSGGAEYVIVSSDAVGAIPLDNGYFAMLRGDFVTPDMYGAKGNGVYDDTAAFRMACGLLAPSDTIRLTDDRRYNITGPVYIDKPIRMIGAQNAVISCTGDGCFIMTNPDYDDERTYAIGDYAVNPPGVDDASVICVKTEDGWAKTAFAKTDEKGSVFASNGSIFDSVVFSWCDKVFTGDLKYITFNACKFTHNNTVFYCAGASENKLNAWFGKIDITNCDFRYNREIFYVSGENFDPNYTLSLNAVNFHGGVINECNVFAQYQNHNDHLFRVESMCLNAVDIEKCDFYGAFDGTDDSFPETTGYRYNDADNPDVIKWIGGLYIYNIVFQNCHFERFSFLYHGYAGSSRGMIRSSVTFDGCYMQLNGKRRLIECDDDTNMNTGSYREISFYVCVINCPMSITMRNKASADSVETIGADHYLVNQPVFPLIKMRHPRYSVVFDNYKNNILLFMFGGKLPATVTVGGETTATQVDVSYAVMQLIRAGQIDTTGGNKISRQCAYEVAKLLANPDSTSAKIDALSDVESALGLSAGDLNNKTSSDIINLITADARTVSQQAAMLSVLVNVLNAGTGNNKNVFDVGVYLTNANVNDLIDASAVSFDMHTSPKGKRVIYRDVAPHYIGTTQRLDTTYVAAKTNKDFLSQIPNGSFVSFAAANNNSEIYYVTNDSYGVQVFNVANAKDHLYYLVLSAAYTSTDFTNRTDWQNCVNLKRIDIQFTPETALPAGLFNGCTALTDVYVPWSKTNTTLNATAPWTNTTGVTVHCADGILE